MIRFHASLLVLVASACGGEVGVGTLANSPNAPSQGGACPSGSDVETIYTTGPDEFIADFVGNVSSVVAALRQQTKTPAMSSLVEFTLDDGNPSALRRRRDLYYTDDVVAYVAGGRSRFCAGVGNGMDCRPWGGDESQFSALLSAPRLVTSHPDRDDVFFVQTGPDSLAQSIWSLKFGEAPKLAMGATSGMHVDSLAVGPSGIVALVTTADDDDGRSLIRPASTNGGGVYERIVQLQSPVSNVVLDGNGAFIATFDFTRTELTVSRYEGTNLKESERTKIGQVVTLTETQSPRAFLAVDGDWVYVAHNPAPQSCVSQVTCSGDLEVVRFKKDGSTAADPTRAVLKGFRGPIASRPFHIDACYFTWYDTSNGTLNRQPKASL